MSRICRTSLPLVLSLVLGCSPAPPGPDAPPMPPDFPDAAAWSTSGPGGPTTTFAQDALWEHCAYLLGGEQDAEHHNLVAMYDGWLVMPWAPEEGGGGVSLFDVSAPCAPVLHGQGYSPLMRESHSLGFSTVNGRDYLAVDYHGGLAVERGGGGDDDDIPTGEVLGGVGFWDITDRAAPVWISELDLPGYHYPDSYTRLTLSVFWQGPWVFVSGTSNGVYIVDASDPTNPTLAAQYLFDPGLLVGSFHVIGNLAMASTAGGIRTVLMDVSDPLRPEPIPGGEFNVGDGDGRPRAYYFANVGGNYGLFARKDGGGGPILYDLRDPSRPRFAGDAPTPDGSGGYVALHGQYVFIGDSNFGSVWDFTEERAPVELGRMQLQGDFDTLVPIGNVAIASVDASSAPGQATAVVPWQMAPDDRGPRVGLTSPQDGDRFVALTGRVGLSFDEQIEPMSVHPGSARLWSLRGDGDGWQTAAVSVDINVQETVVNLTPRAPLEPDTTYVLQLPVGGIADTTGNPLEQAMELRFSTGAAVHRE